MSIQMWRHFISASYAAYKRFYVKENLGNKSRMYAGKPAAPIKYIYS